jgi:two-component system OmpR family sensor kinase
VSHHGATPRTRLFVPWVVGALACVGWMWLAPGQEVVPFHLIWIGFALAYGFEPWPLPQTVVALAVVTLVTGALLVSRAAAGVIAWQETTEIALMLLLAVLVVWHVQRREAALRVVTVLADREAASAARRVRLARLTSHEMRTPLTIASGYVELLLGRQPEPEVREELEVVHDELGRLSRASDRLLRTIQLGERLERSPVDVDALLRETAHRWAAVATRTWEVDAHAGTVTASAERLRACLDTLIENAVRYTDAGDTVRLYGARAEDHLLLGVADAGPGLDAALATAVNARRPHAAYLSRDDGGNGPRSQTGLGLALVQEIMEARSGRVIVGRSREGGALVLLVMPSEPRRGDPAEHAGTGRPVSPVSLSAADAATWAALSPDPMPTTPGPAGP